MWFAGLVEVYQTPMVAFANLLLELVNLLLCYGCLGISLM